MQYCCDRGTVSGMQGGAVAARVRTMRVLPLVYQGRSASCSAMSRRMACPCTVDPSVSL